MFMNRILPIFVLFVFVGLLTEQSAALPRFSSRTGAKCQSCHVNPSGGSIRQAFGVQYGRETLPVPAWSQDFQLEDFTTVLTNFLGVGADFRTLYYYQKEASGSRNSFVQMQGDFYLNFRIAKKVNMFLKKSLGSSYEVFGLLNILPASGHIKIGKFVPNFGTRLDDHSAFIRDSTGFSSASGRPELTGGEVGFSPGAFTIVGGFYNATSADFAEGDNKALLGRAEGLFELGKATHVGLGADVFTTKSTDGSSRTMYGAFGSFSHEDFTVFGEVDAIKTKLGQTVSGLVVYVEADYVVTPGLDLKLAYDFYDRDTDFKTGSTSRYSVGLEFFPLSGVELRPIYRYVKYQTVDAKRDEFNLVVHFYL
jgi:hypothetical protein